MLKNIVLKSLGCILLQVAVYLVEPSIGSIAYANPTCDEDKSVSYYELIASQMSTQDCFSMSREEVQSKLGPTTEFVGSEVCGLNIEQLQLDSQDLARKTQQEAERANFRWNHAKELLGKHYRKSIVRVGERIANLDELLILWTKKSLKGRWKKYAPKIAYAIIRESHQHGFDPVFLLSIIKSESNFNPEAVGGVGELGLMQLTPATAKWIAKKKGIHWKGNESLKNPETNIKIATAYLAYLRDKFDSHSGLYLAAYNMGSGNVYKIRNKQMWPREYASKVMEKYILYYGELKKEL